MKKFLILYIALVWAAYASPVLVNDVTQINPIPVYRVETPKTIEEIQILVKEHKGPVSIGGGRFSMGGQIATENALFLDMRSFNKILSLDAQKKES